MKHRDKLRLARRMLTEDERKIKGLNPFKSSYWQYRALYIRIRVARRNNPALIKSLGL